MEQEQREKQQEQQYAKGFNNGYLLAQYEPNLLKKLLPSLQPGNDYAEGMLSGKEQFDKDNQMVKNDIQKQPGKGKKDREKDR